MGIFWGSFCLVWKGMGLMNYHCPFQLLIIWLHGENHQFIYSNKLHLDVALFSPGWNKWVFSANKRKLRGAPGCVSTSWNHISKCLLGQSHLRNTLVVLRVVIEVWPPRLLWDRRRWEVSVDHTDWWAEPEGGLPGPCSSEGRFVKQQLTAGLRTDPAQGNYLGRRDQGEMLGAHVADHRPPFHLIITLFLVSFQFIE